MVYFTSRKPGCLGFSLILERRTIVLEPCGWLAAYTCNHIIYIIYVYVYIYTYILYIYIYYIYICIHIRIHPCASLLFDITMFFLNVPIWIIVISWTLPVINKLGNPAMAGWLLVFQPRWASLSNIALKKKTQWIRSGCRTRAMENHLFYHRTI